MEIIPKDCLLLLPFVPDPVSTWTDKIDLLRFLACLFDRIRDLSYDKFVFDEGRERFQAIAREFALNARKAIPAEAAKEQSEPIPSFQADPNFGLVSKYAIAWDAIDRAVLEESAFFSLSHVLEAYSELECSILLASNLYYKQALQVLRNFLEHAVLGLYFCGSEEEYEKWTDNDYRVPPFRGRRGMLAKLVARGILTEGLEIIASDIYGELNASIHSAESHLIHRGVFSGQYAGRIFKYDRFQEWCRYFSQCVDFAIRTQHITVKLLARACSK
jgi:hypothetical protein